MENNRAPHRKHYPKLILDLKFTEILKLEEVKVPLTVYIEGNISAGKTELMKHFKDKPNIAILTEPLSLWQDFKGKNLLKLKYENNSKYEYIFQSIANVSRLEQLNEHSHKNIISIMERSIQSSFNVFVKNSKDNYDMDQLTYEALEYTYEVLCTRNTLDTVTCPDLYIYLQTSPEVCYERMKKRNREAEEKVELSFLTNIHEKHERWLNSENSEEIAKCPILILDGNVEKEELGKKADIALGKILKIATEKQLLKRLFPNGPHPLNQGHVYVVKCDK